jgi:hypothetical protein
MKIHFLSYKMPDFHPFYPILLIKIEQNVRMKGILTLQFTPYLELKVHTLIPYYI